MRSITRSMDKTFDLIGHRHVMLRDNTYEIISLMKSALLVKQNAITGP